MANPGMADDERVRELEIKVAFLERHVEEQDRVMHGLAKDLDRLRGEVKRLSERMTSGPGEDAPANERPPHY